MALSRSELIEMHGLKRRRQRYISKKESVCHQYQTGESEALYAWLYAARACSCNAALRAHNKCSEDVSR